MCFAGIYPVESHYHLQAFIIGVIMCKNVILLINEMGLKEGEVLSDTRDRSWDFGVCLWNACSPVSSLGGSCFKQEEVQLE